MDVEIGAMMPFCKVLQKHLHIEMSEFMPLAVNLRTFQNGSRSVPFLAG